MRLNAWHLTQPQTTVGHGHLMGTFMAMAARVGNSVRRRASFCKIPPTSAEQ